MQTICFIYCLLLSIKLNISLTFVRVEVSRMLVIIFIAKTRDGLGIPGLVHFTLTTTPSSLLAITPIYTGMGIEL